MIVVAGIQCVKNNVLGVGTTDINTALMHHVHVRPLKFEMDPHDPQKIWKIWTLSEKPSFSGVISNFRCMSWIYSCIFIYLHIVHEYLMEHFLWTFHLNHWSHVRGKWWFHVSSFFIIFTTSNVYIWFLATGFVLTPDQNHKHEVVEISTFKLRDSNSNCLWGFPPLQKSRSVPWKDGMSILAVRRPLADFPRNFGHNCPVVFRPSRSVFKTFT